MTEDQRARVKLLRFWLEERLAEELRKADDLAKFIIANRARLAEMIALAPSLHARARIKIEAEYDRRARGSD